MPRIETHAARRGKPLVGTLEQDLHDQACGNYVIGCGGYERGRALRRERAGA
jgi:hypothetical protein